MIEHSTDGITFTPFKVISSKGGPNTNAAYKVEYENTKNEITYFRLKEITNANDYFYYKTISVTNCSSSGRSVSAMISPNPISSSTGEAIIKFSTHVIGNTKINLINSVGSSVYESEYSSSENYNAVKLSFKGLSTGVYFLELNNAKGHFRLKFIVVE